MVNNYIPAGSIKPIQGIPDTLPDYTAQVFTPRQQTGPLPSFKKEMVQASKEFYDEPDYNYAREVSQGLQDTLAETPRLTRSEAEEQMHLTELRRQAEGYNENDAVVISQVLAKKYPMTMFAALNDEYFNMKSVVDTVTGAVKNNEAG